MTPKDFGSKHISQIVSAPLSEAFVIVKALIKDDSHSLRSEVEDTEKTYKYLLHYLTEGYQDNSRQDQLGAIREKLLRIADKIQIETEKKDSPLDWYSSMRLSDIRGKGLDSILHECFVKEESLNSLYDLGVSPEDVSDKQNEVDQLLVDLFEFIRTRYHLSRSDKKNLEEALLNAEKNSVIPQLILSGLIVGSLFIYDEVKLELLVSISESPLSDRLSAIALVGIFLTFALFPERAACYGALKDRITLWRDNPIMKNKLRLIAQTVIRTTDTDIVRKTMNDDVIPGIMKLGPDIVRRMRDVSTGADISELEDNPEWAEMLEHSGLRKKLEELNELQSEGADLMMAAFANLKNFPFFRNASNWFIPFNENHSALGGYRKKQLPDITIFFQRATMMADSDKYSFALAIDRIPVEQLKQMSAAVSQQFEQLQEENKSQAPSEKDSSLVVESRQFIRNLYRFVKLFKNGKEIPDCFYPSISLSNLGLLWDVICETDLAEVTAAYYFSRRLYSEALPLFQFINNDMDAHLLEQIGYCEENIGRKSAALSTYEKALLIKPDGKWLLKRLASLIASSEHPDFNRSAEIYAKLLEGDVNNEKLLLKASQMYYKAKDYETALKYLYKLTYLFPENIEAQRLLAWTSLQKEEYQKSRDQFNLLLLSGADPIDYLGSGLISLLTGDLKEGIAYYVEAARMMPLDKFKKKFKEHLQEFDLKHLSNMDTTLLLDAILYKLEK